MEISTLLDSIEASLASAAESGDRTDVGPAMRGFEGLGKLVHEGLTSWEDLQPWARAHAAQIEACYSALEAYSASMGRTFLSGGEEEAERALDDRSRFEFARELFRGTSAIATLEVMTDVELDAEYRDEAIRLGLDPAPYMPRAHTWWRWRD